MTGTDTGVGKTRVGVAVLRALVAAGVRVRPRKPVESGCLRGADDGLLPADAMALREAAGLRESLESICRFRLEAALSPQRAARLAGTPLSLQALVAACALDAGDDFLLVEGAGGFHSPIAEDGLNSDLALALRLPVLLVVADRLGAISQALLAAEAIRSRGLELAAVVLNAAEPATDAALDNSADLEEWLGMPVLRMRHAAGTAVPQPDIDRFAARLAKRSDTIET